MHDPRGFDSVLHTLERKATLTKLEIQGNELNEEHAEKLNMLLRHSESLHTLVLSSCCLKEAGIASSLQTPMSIEELHVSSIYLSERESHQELTNSIRHNKTITKLVLLNNDGGFEDRFESSRWSIAASLSSSRIEISLTKCFLGNQGIYILASSLFSRNGILRNLDLSSNEFDVQVFARSSME
jgi:hypothetical protein